MSWYQVILWTMIVLKSVAFLVFIWWWMFKRATKPYVRPEGGELMMYPMMKS